MPILDIQEDGPDESIQDYLKKNNTEIDENILGTGNFATIHKVANQNYAIKILSKTSEYTDAKNIPGELLPLIFSNSCLHVIKVSEIYLKCNGKITAHSNLQNVFLPSEILGIKMEYMPGFLDLIDRPPTLPSQIKKIFSEVLKGVAYLHENKVLHRDLKPDNILANNKFSEAKIIDFGLGKLEEQCTKENSKCGSLTYVPPETFDGCISTKKTDIWSIAAVIYALTFAEYPFTDDIEKPGKISQNIQKYKTHTSFQGYHKTKTVYSKGEPVGFWPLLNDMLNLDLNKRPSAENALSDYSYFK